MRYDVFSPAKKISAHILLPAEKQCKKLLLNGKETAYETERIGNSVYVNVNTSANGKVCFELLFD